MTLLSNVYFVRANVKHVLLIQLIAKLVAFHLQD